ncbi:predicted protein [Nematostella vectensis]|uniref:Protein-tyrosine sulfotransferase n=1 Tax=Nematostella vectensis TaxID=45351 RepID=A7T0V6_NEMVE|nr:predicted protein [Nematostella vectensis]|eukprot:XP_001622508.1 hypothetical protein NEMVEDRAFT_v1g220623 [Nematostella vectensis]
MVRRLCYMCALAVVILTGLMLWHETGTVRKINYTQKSKSPKSKALIQARKSIFGSSIAKVYDHVNTFVVFIGYPRSGHTLVSSLIDAHPHAIIANEFDIIGNWLAWNDEQRNKYFLFDQLYKNSRTEAKTGLRSSVKHMFNYSVKGQFQGKFKGSLKVIGAKKGGKLTKQLTKQKQADVMDQIMKTLNDTSALEREIVRYFDLVARNQILIRKYKHNLHEIQSTDLISKPRETLRRVCSFLNLTCSKKYLDDCAKIVYKRPSRTRYSVVWTDTQIRRTLSTLKRFAFLKNFTFTS